MRTEFTNQNANQAGGSSAAAAPDQAQRHPGAAEGTANQAPAQRTGVNPFDTSAQASAGAPDRELSFFDARESKRVTFSETSEKVLIKDTPPATVFEGDTFHEAGPTAERETVLTLTQDGVPGDYSLYGQLSNQVQPDERSTSQVFQEAAAGAAEVAGPMLQLAGAALLSPLRMFQGGDGLDAALDPALGGAPRRNEGEDGAAGTARRRGSLD